jgi:hypothetical protein
MDDLLRWFTIALIIFTYVHVVLLSFSFVPIRHNYVVLTCQFQLPKH